MNKEHINRIEKNEFNKKQSDHTMPADQYPVRLIRSRRKTAAIEIRQDLSVLVRAPQRMPLPEIVSFLEEQAGWIEQHREKMRIRMERQKQIPRFTQKEIRQLADQACEVIPQKVSYYAKCLGVTYGRITIRNQKTRWGSCSAKGNLNFNCLLMMTPEEVINYVVVHELCHRIEMNHSKAFWAQVERILPDYRQSRKWLKDHGTELIGRL